MNNIIYKLESQDRTWYSTKRADTYHERETKRLDIIGFLKEERATKEDYQRILKEIYNK